VREGVFGRGLGVGLGWRDVAAGDRNPEAAWPDQNCWDGRCGAKVGVVVERHLEVQ
jgi:hypothetical protein